MKLASAFHSRAYLSLALLLLVSGLLLFLLAQFRDSTQAATAVNSLTLVFLALVWIWLFFGELRTKAVQVTLEGNALVLVSFFGLGPRQVFSVSGFDGTQTSLLPTAYDTYEYLYLLQNGKKKVKLSQFYHKNYNALKEKLVAVVGMPQQHAFSLREEFADIFR